MGVDLFNRTSRSVTITKAGHIFLERAYGVLGAVSRLVSDVSPSNTEVRRLRVGMIVPLTRVDVVAAVGALAESHPGTTVSLLPRGSADSLEGVSAGALDLAIVGLAPGRTHTGLTATALWTEPLSLFVSAEHEWAGRRTVQLSELDGMTTIDRPAGSEARMQTDHAFMQSSVRRGAVVEADSADLVAGLTAAGLGVTLLPSSLASLFPTLHAIDVVDAPTRTVSVVTHPGNTTSVTTAFTDYLLSHRL